jgi:hypothetical protein
VRTSRPRADGSRHRLAPPVSAQFGTDAGTVIRWLVGLLVLLIDPAAIALTVAASRRMPDGPQLGASAAAKKHALGTGYDACN